MKKLGYAEKIATLLLDAIKAGTAPWQKGYTYQQHHNALTEKSYSAYNAMWLAFSGYEDPRWCTFLQAKAEGWKLRKGSKASCIAYAHRRGEEEEGIGGDFEIRETIKTSGNVKKKPPVFVYHSVFNLSDIDGSPTFQATPAFPDIPKIEAMVKNTGANIRFGTYTPQYKVVEDCIVMPHKSQWDNADEYYSSLFHELAHWTCAPKRLNRHIGVPGTVSYATEELIAEMASYMIRSDCAIPIAEMKDSTASYIKFYSRFSLKDTGLQFIRAARQAEKIKKYILEGGKA